MPIPSAISDLSTTPALNSPAGSESPALVDDYLRTHAAFIKQVNDESVKTSGNQTIAGTKTFSSPIAGSVTGSAGSVSGTVAIANGGTGQTTAAAAFNALKQDATDAVTGVVALATTAEAQAGTDTTRAITPARLRDGLNASGSAPIYACRAWVNFNGTGTVAIRASGNVSSITDNGTGDYTVNFTTAMPDVNYATVINTNRSSTNTTLANISRLADELAAPTTTSVRIAQGVPDGNRVLQREDAAFVSVAIFR